MAVASKQISAVRAFNRDYTRRIGVLAQGMLDSPYTLTQARVLYEIEHRPGITATALAADLQLDAGYLSRIVRGFEARGLLRRARAVSDARNQHLRLTAAGRRAYRPLERGSQQQVRDMLARLPGPQRAEVVDAMRSIGEAFTPSARRPVRLRQPAPGDLGWVVERQGVLYAREFGWGEGFEGLVAGIVADFARAADPAGERCWIATQGGRRLGCVFVARRACGCCWWKRRRAGSASGDVWWPSAWLSPGPPATAAWSCGRTGTLPLPATSMRRPASG
jgi:DNA-binding MarR family transcriptional regulator